MGTVEALFDTEYDRLVGSAGVAYDPEAAADAVQEAFIEADRRWTTIGGYDDPAAWVRRVALNRLRTGRRLGRRRSEILATIRPIPEADVTVELLDLRHAIDALGAAAAAGGVPRPPGRSHHRGGGCRARGGRRHGEEQPP